MNTILTSLTGHASDVAVLATATSLASTFSAHVDCFHIRAEYPSEMEFAYAGAFARRGLLSNELERIEAAAQTRRDCAFAFYEKAKSEHALPILGEPKAPVAGASISWTELYGSEIPTLCDEGRYRDLVVMGREPALGTADRIGSVALVTGRPVLIPAAESKPLAVRRVAVAWKERPEAAHALIAAEPFLKAADQILVMTAAEDGAECNRSKLAGDKLDRALRWKGCKTQSAHLAHSDGAVSTSLLDRAVEFQADLLVIGAYGHTRFREIVFGGVTRDIIGAAPIPVLLAH